jgi:hypothetical protein
MHRPFHFFYLIDTLCILHRDMGYAVAQLVEALCYKPGSIPDGVMEIFH